MAILQVRGLTKIYGKGDTTLTALNDVSFEVNKGEFVAIVVASGGKTARVTAVDSIRSTGEVTLEAKQLHISPLVQKLFGYEGALAVKNMKRNRRIFRATVISLTAGTVLFISLSALSRQAGVSPGANILLNHYSHNDNGHAVDIVPFLLEGQTLQLIKADGSIHEKPVQGVLTQDEIPEELFYPNTNLMMRSREFAVLQSVGMTPEGLKRMLNLESILCSAKALIFGIPIAILLIYLINFPIKALFPIPYEIGFATGISLRQYARKAEGRS